MVAYGQEVQIPRIEDMTSIDLALDRLNTPTFNLFFERRAPLLSCSGLRSPVNRLRPCDVAVSISAWYGGWKVARAF